MLLFKEGHGHKRIGGRGTRLVLDTRKATWSGIYGRGALTLPTSDQQTRSYHLIISISLATSALHQTNMAVPRMLNKNNSGEARIRIIPTFFVTPPRQPSNASCRRPASLRMTQVPSILPHPWRSVLPSAYYHRTLLWLTLVFRLSF